jgi:hypothetical protein
MGIDPGSQSEFLTQRYQEVWGTKELGPGSGWLGQLAQGTRALVDPNAGDLPDTPNKPSFLVLGGGQRAYQQWGPNGYGTGLH